MNILQKASVAIAIATTLVAVPAMAASVMKDSMSPVRFKGHKMMVHTMQMDDGSTIYGFTRTQLQQMGVRPYDDPRSTDGSGR